MLSVITITRWGMEASDLPWTTWSKTTGGEGHGMGACVSKGYKVYLNLVMIQNPFKFKTDALKKEKFFYWPELLSRAPNCFRVQVNVSKNNCPKWVYFAPVTWFVMTSDFPITFPGSLSWHPSELPVVGKRCSSSSKSWELSTCLSVSVTSTWGRNYWTYLLASLGC